MHSHNTLNFSDPGFEKIKQRVKTRSRTKNTTWALALFAHGLVITVFTITLCYPLEPTPPRTRMDNITLDKALQWIQDNYDVVINANNADVQMISVNATLWNASSPQTVMEALAAALNAELEIDDDKFRLILPERKR